MRIARVFPRKTEATPNDDLVFFSDPPDGLEIDEAHISVTFSYDKKKAERLFSVWSKKYPTKIGGVAYGDIGGLFIPGMYVKKGYTITSRGCPNECWFCDVWKREGTTRELPICPGNNVLDSNLLACSKEHILAVFDMLKTQKRIQFTGGFEAKLLRKWHLNCLRKLKINQMFFAYDTPDDLDALIAAGKLLYRYNFTRFHCRCYVLIGYKKDTIESAETRLMQAWDAGFMPMAMLWKDKKGTEDKSWRKFQRTWCRPAATKARVLEILARKQ
jgi:hypothetical protein